MSRRGSRRKSSQPAARTIVPQPKPDTRPAERKRTSKIKFPPKPPSEPHPVGFEFPTDFVTREGLEKFAKRSLKDKEEFFLLFSRLLREAVERANGMPN